MLSFWLISSVRSRTRSEEHTSELQSPCNLVCRLLLEKKNKKRHTPMRQWPDATAPPAAESARHLRARPVATRPAVLVRDLLCTRLFCFFFNDTATTEIYTLSLHDALPISCRPRSQLGRVGARWPGRRMNTPRSEEHTSELQSPCNLVCRLLLEKKNII